MRAQHSLALLLAFVACGCFPYNTDGRFGFPEPGAAHFVDVQTGESIARALVIPRTQESVGIEWMLSLHDETLWGKKFECLTHPLVVEAGSTPAYEGDGHWIIVWLLPPAFIGTNETMKGAVIAAPGYQPVELWWTTM